MEQELKKLIYKEIENSPNREFLKNIIPNYFSYYQEQSPLTKMKLISLVAKYNYKTINDFRNTKPSSDSFTWLELGIVQISNISYKQIYHSCCFIKNEFMC